MPRPRDLTPQPGRALDEHAFELTPDGRTAVTGWSVDDSGGGLRKDVVVIDTGTGERRALLSAPGFDFTAPRISPDGKRVVAIRERHESYDQASALTVVMVPMDPAALGTVALDAAPGGDAETLDLLPGLEHWPAELAWAPDGSGVFVTTADHGRGPVLRADLDTGAVTRLTTDHGAYACLCPSPDGQFLYALRSAMDSPPLVVRLDATRPGEPEFLPGPAARPPLPGRLEEIKAAAADGTPLRAWLVLPDAATRGRARAAAAVGTRRPVLELELLVLAVEPVADGSQGLCGPAARPGPVHGLRARVPRARPRRVGEPAVHRPDGHH